MKDIIAFDSSMFFKNICGAMPLAKEDLDSNMIFKLDAEHDTEFRLVTLSSAESAMDYFKDISGESNEVVFICVYDSLSELYLDLLMSMDTDFNWLLASSTESQIKKHIKEKFGSNVLTYAPEYMDAGEFKSLVNLFVMKKKGRFLDSIVAERDSYKNSILYFMQFVSEVRNVEIHTNSDLYSYLFNSSANFLRSRSGAFVAFNRVEDSINIEYAHNAFEAGENFLEQVHDAVKTRDVVTYDGRNLIALRMAGSTEYVLVLDDVTMYRSSFIFNSILRSIALICNNAILTHTIDVISKEEKLKTLNSISSTITHYANNALAAIKGFSLELEHVDDIDTIKRNLRFIYESCNIIEAVINTLTHLSYEDLHNTIEVPILHLSIINIEQQLQEKIKQIKENDALAKINFQKDL